MKNKNTKKIVLCEECEKPISAKRLKALPNTVLCIDCAEAREDSGEFIRSQMEVNTEISGWEFEGVTTKIIKGE